MDHFEGGHMNLRRLLATAFTAIAMFVCLAGMVSPTSAQVAPVSKVEFTVSGLDYDVLYLADFLDIGTGKLKEFVPAFSAEMRPLPVGSSSRVTLGLTTVMILQDDPNREGYTLTDGVSGPFTFGPAPRSVYSKDLIRGGSTDIRMTPRVLWNTSNPGKAKLEDHLKRFPSAPVGTYRFIIQVKDYATGAVLGQTQYDLVVRNASAEEVVVTLIDPQPGEIIRTTSPQFTWRADRECEVHIYERLPMMRSTQDAVSGVPHAIINTGSAQTTAYPASGRRLEYGKTYVWFVRTKVRTNRGDEFRDSEIRSFRILSAGQDISSLRDALDVNDEALAGTLSTLESMGWIPNGDITLDGKPISREEAKALLRAVAAKKKTILVRVE
jgi:hypothetical protein